MNVTLAGGLEIVGGEAEVGLETLIMFSKEMIEDVDKGVEVD